MLSKFLISTGRVGLSLKKSVNILKTVTPFRAFSGAVTKELTPEKGK